MRTLEQLRDALPIVAGSNSISQAVNALRAMVQLDFTESLQVYSSETAARPFKPVSPKIIEGGTGSGSK